MKSNNSREERLERDAQELEMMASYLRRLSKKFEKWDELSDWDRSTELTDFRLKIKGCIQILLHNLIC